MYAKAPGFSDVFEEPRGLTALVSMYAKDPEGFSAAFESPEGLAAYVKQYVEDPEFIPYFDGPGGLNAIVTAYAADPDSFNSFFQSPSGLVALVSAYQQDPVSFNTANPHPVIGNGTDSAIYHAAGEMQLLAEREKIGEIDPGQAFATPAFNLSAKHIIHTVGPLWIDGNHGERDILRSCYNNSLSLAAELNAESIAFPLIATGVYGFPKDEALNIALAEIGKFLLTHDMTVILVVFDKKAFELSGQLIGQIDEYIDEYGVGLAQESEYYGYDPENLRRHIHEETALKSVLLEDTKLEYAETSIPASASTAFVATKGKSLDEVLGSAGETFQQRLFKLIDASGMDDVTVYKKANIDRKVFSRIRCNEDYKPKKRTAVAFAIALKLDMPAMLDLLSRAEIAFSPSNKFDLIITYFVTHSNYNIFEINAALFNYGQPILGE